jgi:hypothetical protein
VCAGVGAVGVWQAAGGDAPPRTAATSSGSASPTYAPSPSGSGSLPGYDDGAGTDGPLDLDIQFEGRLISAPDKLLKFAAVQDALAKGVIEEVKAPDMREQGLIPRVLLDDGSFVVESIEDQAEPTSLTQTRTGVLAGGRVTLWPTVHVNGVDRRVPRQGEAADAFGGVVAWVETPSTDLATDSWSVFSHRLDGQGASVPIASSEDLLPDELLPIKGPYIQPSVGSSRVFWGSPYPLGSAVLTLDDLGVGIFGKDLDGRGSLDRLADGGILPTAVGEDVVYVRVSGYDPALPEGRFVIARRDGEAKTPEEELVSGVLAESTQFEGMVATESHLVWALRGGSSETATSRINILDLRSGVLSAVDVESAYGVTRLGIDGDSLVFATDAERGIVRLSDMNVYRLPDGEGLAHSLMVAGSYVSWEEAGDGPFGVLKLARITD